MGNSGRKASVSGRLQSYVTSRGEDMYNKLVDWCQTGHDSMWDSNW